jgi:hypothetical protein
MWATIEKLRMLLESAMRLYRRLPSLLEGELTLIVPCGGRRCQARHLCSLEDPGDDRRPSSVRLSTQPLDSVAAAEDLARSWALLAFWSMNQGITMRDYARRRRSRQRRPERLC